MSGRKREMAIALVVSIGILLIDAFGHRLLGILPVDGFILGWVLLPTAMWLMFCIGNLGVPVPIVMWQAFTSNFVAAVIRWRQKVRSSKDCTGTTGAGSTL